MLVFAGSTVGVPLFAGYAIHSISACAMAALAGSAITASMAAPVVAAAVATIGIGAFAAYKISQIDDDGFLHMHFDHMNAQLNQRLVPYCAQIDARLLAFNAKDRLNGESLMRTKNKLNRLKTEAESMQRRMQQATPNDDYATRRKFVQDRDELAARLQTNITEIQRIEALHRQTQ